MGDSFEDRGRVFSEQVPATNATSYQLSVEALVDSILAFQKDIQEVGANENVTLFTQRCKSNLFSSFSFSFFLSSFFFFTFLFSSLLFSFSFSFLFFSFLFFFLFLFFSFPLVPFGMNTIKFVFLKTIDHNHHLDGLCFMINLFLFLFFDLFLFFYFFFLFSFSFLLSRNSQPAVGSDQASESERR